MGLDGGARCLARGAVSRLLGEQGAREEAARGHEVCEARDLDDPVDLGQPIVELTDEGARGWAQDVRGLDEDEAVAVVRAKVLVHPLELIEGCVT